jgi:poly(A) polymerase
MVLKKLKALLTRKPKRSRPETIESPDTRQPAPHGPASSAVPAAAPFQVHRGPEVVHHPVALQDLDQDAVRIVKRLARFEYTAYLVGGCVRDLLLDRRPKDFDIGTSATPRQIKRLFSNCRIIGRRFRLAHIYFQNGKIIEVATFRAKDGADASAADVTAGDVPDAGAPESADDDVLIRDDNVFGTPEEDALRRDFTINALFYDVNAETVIDHADGLGDLRRRLVRTIGDPATRFREDPIRILRALKFAARLDFTIEPATLAALRATRVEIPKAAPPRVLEEFNRFCRSGAGRRSFELCFETGVFEVIVPELATTYEREGPAQRVLLALLEAIDARWNRGLDVGTGEIFAALLFAAVAPSLGWALDGSPARPDGRDARTIVDDAIRPMAVRLRIARKDQEHVRQTLAILHRMVPVRAMRRGAKLAMMRRPSFGDALAMLETLAPILGGAFAAAKDVWVETAAARGAEPVRERELAPAADEPADPGAEGPAGRRRRGRRGGRRRRKSQDAAVSAVPAAPAERPLVAAPKPKHPQPPPARASHLPPVWDDNYFFAALPSVPKLPTDVEEHDTDRYGAGIVANVSPRDVASGGRETDDSRLTNPSPKPRRRRRGGRGRRKGGPIMPPGGDSAPPEGDES